MRRFTIDALQLLISSAYAYLLERYKRRLTNDTTWVQVVVGVGYTLLFIGLRFRQRQAWTPEQAERVIWRSFVTSGLPIVAWQLWHSYENHRAADQRLWEALQEQRDDQA